MNKVNIHITGSKGSVSIDLNVLPDNLAEVITLANKMVSGNDDDVTELDKELLALINNGTMLQAVKLKRDKSGLGLREAKDYCDALVAKFIKN